MDILKLVQRAEIDAVILHIFRRHVIRAHGSVFDAESYLVGRVVKEIGKDMVGIGKISCVFRPVTWHPNFK